MTRIGINVIYGRFLCANTTKKVILQHATTVKT